MELGQVREGGEGPSHRSTLPSSGKKPKSSRMTLGWQAGLRSRLWDPLTTQLPPL